MSDPDNTLGSKAPIVVALLPVIETLSRHLQDGLHDNPKGIHQARVAMRRLKTGFEVYKYAINTSKLKSWAKVLKRFRRALGQARDLDVQLEYLADWSTAHPLEAHQRPGFERLQLRLKQRRSELETPLLAMIERFEKSKVLNELKLWLNRKREVSAGDGQRELLPHALNYLKKNVNELLLLAKSLPIFDRSQEQHDLRISAKHLRYALEFYAPLFETHVPGSKRTITVGIAIERIKALQTTLGVLHDCDVWIEFLPTFKLEEHERTRNYFGYEQPFEELRVGLEHFEGELLQERKTLHEHAKTCWEQLERDGIVAWLIDLPIILSTERNLQELHIAHHTSTLQ